MVIHSTERGPGDIRLSASGLDKFNSCPRRWAYYYLDKVPDGTGPSALIGGYVHEAIEEFYKLKRHTRTEDALKDIARSQWDGFQALYQEELHDGNVLTEQEINNIKHESWQSLSGLWAIEDPTEVLVHSTEMQLDVEFEGIPFIGFIDRLDHLEDGSLVVIDYKSGKVPKPKFTPSKLMQLLLYAWALEQLGIETSTAKLYFLKNDTVIATDVNAANMSEVKRYLAKTVESIHRAFEEGFEPKTGPLCGWCPYILQCKEGEEFTKKMRTFKRMRLDAPALKLLDDRDRPPPMTEDELKQLFGSLK